MAERRRPPPPLGPQERVARAPSEASRYARRSAKHAVVGSTAPCAAPARPGGQPLRRRAGGADPGDHFADLRAQSEFAAPAKVILDGKPLGFTPKVGVIAPAGEHSVIFRWDDADKHTSVTCAKGEAKTVAVRLYEPSSSDERLERNPYR